MGRTPETAKKPTARKQAHIVSFSDAQRSAKRSAAPTARKGGKPALSNKAASPKARKSVSAKKPTSEQRKEKPDKKAKKSRMASFAEKSRQRSESRKRARNKAKADKQFEKAFGGSKDASAKASQGSQGGDGSSPRAAIYEGKATSSQKKSAKLQAKGAMDALKGVGSRVSVPKVKLPAFAKKLGRTACVAGILALFCVALYGPAQQYYQQMRETDRLQAEYAAVSARNDTLQSTIDSLSSDAGIEDKAHADLGYVKKNEQSATVKGLNLVDEREFSSNVAPGSVPAPVTWYSPFLDTLFNYDK